MTSDQLADLVVAELNAIDDPPIAFQAVNPPEVPDPQAERNNFQVFVLPFDESESPINLSNDTCREERRVSIFVHGPIGSVTRAKAIEFCEVLRSSLKGTRLGDYLWDGNETVSLFDADALKNKNQFLSLFRATYYTFD
jgi:hypothetical protein